MGPLESYKILKEHLMYQDNLIRQKVIGVLMANSVLLMAFFLSRSAGNFDVFRCSLIAFAIFLNIGFLVSLVFDVKAKRKSMIALLEVEHRHDFAYPRSIRGRPFADIERRARGPLKVRQIADLFWPLLCLVFVILWVLIWLKAG